MLRIRRNWVNGELTDVKTPKSRLDIPLTPTVKAAIKRCLDKMPAGTSYIADDSLVNADHYIDKLYDKAVILSKNPEISSE